MGTESRCPISLVKPEHEPSKKRGSLSSRSDDDLMLLARGGVSDAFDVLVRRHQTNLLNVAYRLVGRTAVAADVTQNTFMAVYRALPQYQPCGKFMGYIYRVLLNQCRVVKRSVRAENTVLLAFAQAPREAAMATDDYILARERQREVQTALDKLSPKLKEVVVLRFSAALSYDEIANVLGIPIGTVKRRLFDATGMLRVAMEGT